MYENELSKMIKRLNMDLNFQAVIFQIMLGWLWQEINMISLNVGV